MLMRRPKQPDDRSESGTMAVEFALAMPMLILFVGACIQFGTLFFVQQRMENTARQVLQLMVAQDLSDLTDPNLAESPVEVTCENLVAEDPASSQKTTCELLSNMNMGFKVTAVQPVPIDPANRDVSLTITVPMADAALVDILGLFGSETMQTSITMRKSMI